MNSHDSVGKSSILLCSVFLSLLAGSFIFPLNSVFALDCPESQPISAEASTSACAGACGVAGGVLIPGITILGEIPYTPMQGVIAEGFFNKASSEATASCKESLDSGVAAKRVLCNQYCSTQQCYSQLKPDGGKACHHHDCISSGGSAVLPRPNGGVVSGRANIVRVTCKASGKASFICRCAGTLEELLSTQIETEEEWNSILEGY